MREGLVKLGNIYSFYVFQLVLPQINLRKEFYVVKTHNE